MGGGIVLGRDRTERHVSHVVEQIVIRHIARADQLDAALVETALHELLHELRADAGGHEHEQSVRLGVCCLLQEG